MRESHSAKKQLVDELCDVTSLFVCCTVGRIPVSSVHQIFVVRLRANQTGSVRPTHSSYDPSDA